MQQIISTNDTHTAAVRCGGRKLVPGLFSRGTLRCISHTLIFSCIWVIAGCASRSTQPMEGHAEPMVQLQSGNRRFCEERPLHPHLDTALRADLASHGQHPIATILACSDSRVPVELIFDQGIGDLFIIRVAGNVAGTDETGSVEYAVEHLHCPLFIVLGHRHCGAVTAAVKHVEDTPSILTLLKHIEPAVDRARRREPGLSGEPLIEASVRENVWQSIADLLTVSDVLREQTGAGRVQVVGAVYDIESGTVEWLGPHPDQTTLVAGGR